ncbi:hypothetical protein DLAC_03812 [Tieghemostelium lacteum]|uniref:Uncharacterized protein n=1 Tax=Tieghemostelium lacteum TaxID=361077 RepID=A0A152A0Y1_TIELA|nr:hypothetical protein DLAC_03812 [Tieghemostelium lacteum]|eukprot:KYQ99858.1 hypothetical protein DLAC_03812 [Tieghemostelium lacteum]
MNMRLIANHPNLVKPTDVAKIVTSLIINPISTKHLQKYSLVNLLNHLQFTNLTTLETNFEDDKFIDKFDRHISNAIETFNNSSSNNKISKLVLRKQFDTSIEHFGNLFLHMDHLVELEMVSHFFNLHYMNIDLVLLNSIAIHLHGLEKLKIVQAKLEYAKPLYDFIESSRSLTHLYLAQIKFPDRTLNERPFIECVVNNKSILNYHDDIGSTPLEIVELMNQNQVIQEISYSATDMVCSRYQFSEFTINNTTLKSLKIESPRQIFYNTKWLNQSAIETFKMTHTPGVWALHTLESPKLQRISVTLNCQAQNITSSLIACQTLQILDLGLLENTKEQWDLIFETFVILPNLKALKCIDSNISIKTLSKLIISNHPSLISLDIGKPLNKWNGFELIEAFNLNCTLVYLNLNRAITEYGTSDLLISLLNNNSSLVSIGYSTSFYNKEIPTIIDAITNNRSVRHLYIDDVSLISDPKILKAYETSMKINRYKPYFT